jgi:hypothetical protein
VIDDMTDEELVGQADRARQAVGRVISSLSQAPTSEYPDGPRALARRAARTDSSDDACEAVLELGARYAPDTDTDPDTDDEGETELDRRALVRRRPDPDADLRPPPELVSAEAELDLAADVARLAEACDLALRLGSRLLQRAKPAVWPAAATVAVVSALLVLVGALIGAVFTLGGVLLLG